MGFTQCVPPRFGRAVLGVGNYQQGLIAKHLFCLDGRHPVFVNALCRVRRIPVKTGVAAVPQGEQDSSQLDGGEIDLREGMAARQKFAEGRTRLHEERHRPPAVGRPLRYPFSGPLPAARGLWAFRSVSSGSGDRAAHRTPIRPSATRPSRHVPFSSRKIRALRRSRGSILRCNRCPRARKGFCARSRGSSRR